MFDPIVPASCERGTAATRAIAPRRIDHEHRQVARIDEERRIARRYGMMPPADGPYEFAPPLTESAMTVVVAERIVEHHELALLDVVDDEHVPPGSWRTATTLPSVGLDASLRRVDQSNRRCRCRLLRGEWQRRRGAEGCGRSLSHMMVVELIESDAT